MISWLLGFKNVIIAVLITAALGWTYSQWQFRQGIEAGKQIQISLQSEVDSKVQEAKEQLQLEVVQAIKNIQVVNTTINNKAIKEVIKEKVYEECKLPDSGKIVANEALKPREVTK